jgi:hypothetical protein
MKELSTGKIVAGVFFGLFLFFVVMPMALCGGCATLVGIAGTQTADKSGGGSVDLSAPTSYVAPEPAQEVALRTLLSDYKDNEVRADGQYKDKRVVVRGVVGDVKKGLLDEIYVTIGTGKKFEIPVVQCFVSKADVASASALNQGDEVEVEGDVDGLMMNVIVRNCRIR